MLFTTEKNGKDCFMLIPLEQEIVDMTETKKCSGIGQFTGKCEQQVTRKPRTNGRSNGWYYCKGCERERWRKRQMNKK